MSELNLDGIREITDRIIADIVATALCGDVGFEAAKSAAYYFVRFLHISTESTLTNIEVKICIEQKKEPWFSVFNDLDMQLKYCENIRNHETKES
jgi:hypothetical protein